MRAMPAAGQPCVYILRCCDGSFYCGASKNLQNRINRHKTGWGSRYVLGRLPFELVYWELAETWPAALRRERQIKKLNRKAKGKLIEKFKDEGVFVSLTGPVLVYPRAVPLES